MRWVEIYKNNGKHGEFQTLRTDILLFTQIILHLETSKIYKFNTRLQQFRF